MQIQENEAGNTLPSLSHSEPPIYSNSVPQTSAPVPVPSFKIAREKCQTCIFGPNSPISAERLREHIANILAHNSYAICHTAQIVFDTDSEESKTSCRGFYDAYKNATLVMRLAQLLDIVEEVELPKAEWENQQDAG